MTVNESVRPAPPQAPDRLPQLTAVMPAYNEQEVLPLTLKEAVAALAEVADEWEIVVVDDGSTDRTPAILAEWAARDPRLWILTQRPNQGYSRAWRGGFGRRAFQRSSTPTPMPSST